MKVLPFMLVVVAKNATINMRTTILFAVNIDMISLLMVMMI